MFPEICSREMKNRRNCQSADLQIELGFQHKIQDINFLYNLLASTSGAFHFHGCFQKVRARLAILLHF